MFRTVAYIFVQSLFLWVLMIGQVHAQELPPAGRAAQDFFVQISPEDFNQAGTLNEIGCLGDDAIFIGSLFAGCKKGIYKGNYSPHNSKPAYPICFKGRDDFAPHQQVLNNSPKLIYVKKYSEYSKDGYWLALAAEWGQDNKPYKWHKGEPVTPIVCTNIIK